MHLIAHNPGCCNYTAFSLIKCFPLGFKLHLNLKLYSQRVEYLSLATAASVSQFVSFAHLLLNERTHFPGTPLVLLPGFPGGAEPSRLSSTTCSPPAPPAPPPRRCRRPPPPGTQPRRGGSRAGCALRQRYSPRAHQRAGPAQGCGSGFAPPRAAIWSESSRQLLAGQRLPTLGS